ncbi:MAG: hypothetical protein LBU32_01815 [Clostridiales bacterium]|jgi:hypothetical protein|nr:hypothetical protein [Clostridiales bacterium]
MHRVRLAFTAGFKDGSAPAAARKIAESRDNPEMRGVEFTEKEKKAQFINVISKTELNSGVQGRHIGIEAV